MGFKRTRIAGGARLFTTAGAEGAGDTVWSLLSRRPRRGYPSGKPVTQAAGHETHPTCRGTLRFLAAPSADARTWYVKPDSTGDTPTIQSAIDSAEVGDEVVLAAGTYSLTTQGAFSPWRVISMKAGITLRGEANREDVVIDGEGGIRVIYYDGDVGETQIADLTITGGAPVGGEGGGGIVALSTDASQLTISNCVIRDNYADGDGGGIFCRGATITGCQILNNHSGFFRGRGGGAYSENGRISGCLFRGNSASGVEVGGSGGGVYDAGSTTISDCRFEGNSAHAGGGVAGGVSILRCVFVGNRAGPSLNFGGAGGAVISGGDIVGCVFVDNEALGNVSNPGRGGAVYAYGASASIMSCTLIGNKADGGPSAVGGLYHEGFGGNAMVSATIITATQWLACDGAMSFACCNLFGNVLGDSICGSDSGGNFSADPQFCAVDPATSFNFTLQQDSPCAPGNHPAGTSCGLIGAAAVGCEQVSLERRSWTRVKRAYR